MVTPGTVDELLAGITHRLFTETLSVHDVFRRYVDASTSGSGYYTTAWATFQAASFSTSFGLQAALIQATNTLLLSTLEGSTFPSHGEERRSTPFLDPEPAPGSRTQTVVTIIGSRAKPHLDPIHSDDWITSALAFRAPFGMAEADPAEE